LKKERENVMEEEKESSTKGMKKKKRVRRPRLRKKI